MVIESGMLMMPAQNTRNAELTSRSPSRLETGSWLANDVPASPCRSPPTQLKYCWITGWSRCSCSRSAFRLAGVAVRPRIARAGSPGRAWVAANTTTETAPSTSSPSSTRRSMKPVMPPGLKRRSPRSRGRAAGGGPAITVGLGEPDGSEAMSERIEVQRRLAHLEALHLLAVRVDQVVEERDDVPAVVVFLGLHLVDDVAPLRLVDLGQGLFVQAEVVRPRPRLRRPVALVVRRGRHAAVRHLWQEVARSPEVHRERQLQVLVAVVFGVVVDVHGHAGGLRLGGEDVRRVDHAGGAVGRVQVHR